MTVIRDRRTRPKASPLYRPQRRLAAWLLAPAALLVGIFVAYPMVDSIIVSFTSWSGIRGASRDFIGFDNYVQMVQDPTLGRALLNNLLWIVVGTAGAVGLGLIAALVLNASVKGSGVYRTIFFIPQIIGGALIGVIFLQVFAPYTGAVYQAGEQLGIEAIQRGFLGVPEYVMPVLLGCAIWGGFGFYMVILFAGLQSVDPELTEAAMLDGAGVFARVWHVILPQIANTLNIAIVLALIGGLQVFDIIFVMTGGGPAGISEVISTYAYRKAFAQFDAGYASALTLLITVLSVVISVIFLRVREGKADRG